MLLVKTKLAPSPINGLGLFAAQKIAKGTIVWQLNTAFERCISLAESSYPLPARDFIRKYGYFDLTLKCWVLCLDDARFCNHSETPNTGTNPADWSSDIAFVDIAEGEEITCDYRTFDGEWKEKLNK